MSDKDLNEDKIDDENNDKVDNEPRKRKRKRKTAIVVDEDDNNDNSEIKEQKITGPVAETLANSRTVYVEGLPFTATEKQVRDFFKDVGPAGSIKSLRLVRWHDSDRLKGYGHVEFISEELAERALELDGVNLMNRYITVKQPMIPRMFQVPEKSDIPVVRPSGCRSVFVKNIPYDTTEDEVTEVMKICGPITTVRLAIWGHTNKLKGFGYVDFKREESAEIAVKKSGILLIKGRPILIDFETGVAKGGFKNNKK